MVGVGRSLLRQLSAGKGRMPENRNGPPESVNPQPLLGVAALAVALALFWMTDRISRLDTKVFPPRHRKDMLQNAVWIDAPAHIWHHG
jgi:hypothetical protein